MGCTAKVGVRARITHRVWSPLLLDLTFSWLGSPAFEHPTCWAPVFTFCFTLLGSFRGLVLSFSSGFVFFVKDGCPTMPRVGSLDILQSRAAEGRRGFTFVLPTSCAIGEELLFAHDWPWACPNEMPSIFLITQGSKRRFFNGPQKSEKCCRR